MAYFDLSKYLVLPEETPYQPAEPKPEQNSGLMGDAVDATQQGFYQAIGGVSDFFGADGIADWAQSKADEQMATMSDAGRETLSQSIYTSEDGFNTDALTSLDFWVLNVANQVGQFAATAPLGGVAGRAVGALGNATKIGKAAGGAISKGTGGVVNPTTAGVALTGGGAAAGMAGQEAAQEAGGVIDNAPLGTLLESEMFVKAREQIAKQNPDMSAEDQMFAAKELLKEQIKDTVMYDPKVVATSMGGAFLGDNVLLGLFTKNAASKIASSRLGNAAMGAAVEGPTEALQAAVAQRSTNEQLQPIDGRGLNYRVAEAAVNEGILGAAMGGGLGAAATPNRDRVQKTADDLRANGSDALAAKIEADADAADKRAAERESFIRADDLDQPTFARRNGARTAQDVGYLGDMLLGTEAQDAIARQQNPVLDPNVDTSPTELDRFLPVPSAGRLEVEPGQTAIPDMRDRGGPVSRRVYEGELVEDDTPRRSRVDGLLPRETIEGEVIRDDMPPVQPRIGQSSTIFAGDGRPQQRFDDEVAAARRNQVPQIEDKNIIFAGDQTGVNLRSNGQPFSSERAAVTTSAALQAKREGKEIEAVPFADGFGWRVVDGTAMNQQRSAVPTTGPAPSREEIGDRATPEQEQAPAVETAGAEIAASNRTEPDAELERGMTNLLSAITSEKAGARKTALQDLSRTLRQPMQKQGEDMQATTARLSSAVAMATKIRRMTPEQIEAEFPTANDLKQAMQQAGITPRGSKAVMRDSLKSWADGVYTNAETTRTARRSVSAIEKLTRDQSDIPLELISKARPASQELDSDETFFYTRGDLAVARAYGLDRVPEPRGRGLTADQRDTFAKMDELLKAPEEVLSRELTPETLRKAVAASAEVRRIDDSMLSDGVDDRVMQELGFPKNTPSTLRGVVAREIRRMAAKNGLSLRRVPEFDADGNRNGNAGETEVTYKGQTVNIYRDPEQGWWYRSQSTGEKLEHFTQLTMGFNKAEAIERAIALIDSGKLAKTSTDGGLELSGYTANDLKPSNPPSTGAVQKMVDAFAERLNLGKFGITVRVVKDQNELRLVTGAKLQGKFVKGAYNNDTKVVYLVAGNMQSVTEARRVLAHEVIAHAGLKNVVGAKTYQQFLDRINSTRGKKAFADLWKFIDANYSVDGAGNKISADVKAEELFARFIEQQSQKGELRYWFDSVLNWLKDALVKLGILDRDTDITMMRDMAKAIEKGFAVGKVAGSKSNREAQNAVRSATEAGRLSDAGALRGSQITVAEDGRPESGTTRTSGETPQAAREADGSLKGLPRRVKLPSGKQITAKHYKPAADAAKAYMESVGRQYKPHSEYVKADPERGARIAAAYEAMKDDPNNPEVKAAYEAMAQETLDQFKFVRDSGLVVEFYPTDSDGNIVDPYPDGPRMATEDVINNNHLYVYPTRDGYGQDGITDADAEINPMLRESGFDFGGEPALINDVFRAVHDFFGHIKEGVGFRADGEENAWQSHAAMYSPLARRAMTTETRGQNSWLNFGPYGASNRNAKVEDTVFAEQKIGLLPEWVTDEGRRGGDDNLMLSGVAVDEPKFTNRNRGVEAIMDGEGEQAVSKARDMLNKLDAGQTAKKGMFKLLTLRQFVELADKLFGGKDKSPLRKYLKSVSAMMTARETAGITVGNIAGEVRKWATQNKAQADKLFDLMHDATLAQLDPDPQVGRSPAKVTGELLKQLDQAEKLLKEARFLEADPITISALESRIEQINGAIKDMEENADAEFEELRARFDALPSEAREFYRQMRQVHRDNNALYHKLMLERIEKAQMNPDRRKVMMAQIRMEQEFGQVLGPYFPLGRFGDYVIEFMQDGERVVYAVESSAEAEKKAERLRAAGEAAGITDVKVTARTERDFKRDGASFLFMNDLFAEIQEKQENGEITAGDASAVTELVYALYLKHLPERSMRKNRIKRKGIGGFSNDALRSFADVAMKNAYQLSRLEYFDELNGAVKETEDMTKAAAETKGNNVAEVAVFNELRKRHEWVMNPQNAKWARSLNALGFVYMLGVSPIAAVLNVVQSFNVGLPVIKSMVRNGNTLSMAKDMVVLMGKFLKASVQGSKWNEWQVGFDENRDDGMLSTQERELIRELRKTGVLTQSGTHNALAIAELGAQDEGFSDRTNQALEMVGKLFHSAEVLNREVTALVAYRAMRKSGMGHKEAIEKAGEAVWESHFDYTNVNRAPFMQSDIAKVMFQFKQYSQQMSYYLVRNGLLSIKGGIKTLSKKDMTPEERQEYREAMAKLGGTLATTAVIGGTAALPTLGMYQVVKMIAEAVLGEEDEPYDLEAEMRKWLVDNVGEDAADLVVYGVTGAGFSQRVSMANLWMNEPYREPQNGEGWWTHIAKQVAGPTLGGLATNFLTGANMIGNGEFYRGTEKMLPKFARDYMVAYRYYEEGATTLRGDTLKEASEFNPMELFLQSQGLADSDVVKQYAYNSTITGATDALRNRRKRLLDKFYLAVSTNDEALRVEAIEDIRRFNSNVADNYPQATINRKQLVQSIRSRATRSEKTEDGLYVDGLTADVVRNIGYR